MIERINGYLMIQSSSSNQHITYKGFMTEGILFHQFCKKERDFLADRNNRKFPKEFFNFGQFFFIKGTEVNFSNGDRVYTKIVNANFKAMVFDLLLIFKKLYDDISITNYRLIFRHAFFLIDSAEISRPFQIPQPDRKSSSEVNEPWGVSLFSLSISTEITNFNCRLMSASRRASSLLLTVIFICSMFNSFQFYL